MATADNIAVLNEWEGLVGAWEEATGSELGALEGQHRGRPSISCVCYLRRDVTLAARKKRRNLLGDMQRTW